MAEVVEGTVEKEDKEEVVTEVVVETKEPEGKSEPQKKEYTETEQQAIDQGWNPDFDGPNQRSAREFLDRGELLTKIKQQSAELRKVTDMVGALSDHNKQVYKAGYERAIKDLRVAKAQAIDKGEGATVVQIDEAIDNHQAELRKLEARPTTQQQVGPTQEFTSFVERNDWYKETASMRHWAHGMAIEFAKVNPDATEADVYKFIEKEVRKEFPAKFNRRGPPSPDGEGRQVESKSTKGGSGSFEKLLATLPEDQARVAREMVKRNVLTKEKYVEDYERIGR